MSLQDATLSEQQVQHLSCPHCGHDIQEDDTYVQHAHSIGEVYILPYCPECNLYNEAYNLEDTDWWNEA
jgi:C4-type Zn-finger protein